MRSGATSDPGSRFRRRNTVSTPRRTRTGTGSSLCRSRPLVVTADADESRRRSWKIKTPTLSGLPIRKSSAAVLPRTHIAPSAMRHRNAVATIPSSNSFRKPLVFIETSRVRISFRGRRAALRASIRRGAEIVPAGRAAALQQSIQLFLISPAGDNVPDEKEFEETEHHDRPRLPDRFRIRCQKGRCKHQTYSRYR